MRRIYETYMSPMGEEYKATEEGNRISQEFKNAIVPIIRKALDDGVDFLDLEVLLHDEFELAFASTRIDVIFSKER